MLLSGSQSSQVSLTTNLNHTRPSFGSWTLEVTSSNVLRKVHMQSPEKVLLIYTKLSRHRGRRFLPWYWSIMGNQLLLTLISPRCTMILNIKFSLPLHLLCHARDLARALLSRSLLSIRASCSMFSLAGCSLKSCHIDAYSVPQHAQSIARIRSYIQLFSIPSTDNSETDRGYAGTAIQSYVLGHKDSKRKQMSKCRTKHFLFAAPRQ